MASVTRKLYLNNFRANITVSPRVTIREKELSSSDSHCSTPVSDLLSYQITPMRLLRAVRARAACAYICTRLSAYVTTGVSHVHSHWSRSLTSSGSSVRIFHHCSLVCRFGQWSLIGHLLDSALRLTPLILDDL
jgi:hypothetical protein